MRFAKAGWAAAAVVLLFSGGCDYWNNLVDEKTLTRADLEVTVVDAWTGETFKDADCRDSLSGTGLAADGQGHYRIQGGSTGLYEIRCDHIWYYPGAAKVHLSKGGAHDTVRLARQGEHWYPDPSRNVFIPRLEKGFVRFPTDLDWQVTPWDTTGRFRYEWTFRQATALNHGHLKGEEQLDQGSYSPRFRAQATADGMVREGKDTAILTVYSLMNGGQAGYPVGSDTLYFDWVRNRKPFIYFRRPSDSTPYKVGCLSEPVSARVLLQAGDSDVDGRCSSMRFWASLAPSVRLKDTILSCDLAPIFTLPLSRPFQSGIPQPDRSEVYGNTLYAEITDDNGEKSLDSVTIITHTNSPPTETLRIKHDSGAFYQGNGTYFVGEPVTFEIKARDTDGGITRMDIHWIGASNDSIPGPIWRSVDPHGDSLPDYGVTKIFETPGNYWVVGRALDDCGDWTDSVSLSFTVQKNIPPTIQITHPDTSITAGGDSLWVKFKLSITDPDATIVGKDGIKLLRINWDNYDTQVEMNRTQPISSAPFQYKFPMPPPGSSLSIAIHVEDQHFDSADTVIHVP